MISGFATPAGTERLATRHEGLAFNLLGKTGLTTSQAGFGSYRVSDHDEDQRIALRDALQSGINLIDTSANYGDGGAERLIGQVVAALIDAAEIARDELIIVSKAGYLQGENLALSQDRKAAGKPFPDLIEYMPGLEHCIHPEFLTDQLDRSLARLDMATLDIYLLHNPEYYLSWAAKEGLALTAARDEYYRRLTLALTHLESEVAAGRIKGYGLSSNSLPYPAADPEFTSLDRILHLVSQHNLDHFCCIQLPGNLLETGLVTERNQPDGTSVLTQASRHHLAVLVNRPLNAIVANSLIRLVSLPPVKPPTPAKLSTMVDNLAQLEAQFAGEILPGLLLSAAERAQAPLLAATGRILAERWRGFGSWQQWEDVQRAVLIPRLRAVAEMLLKRRNLPAEAREWLERYGGQAEVVLEALGRHYQAQSAQTAQQLQAAVAAADPDWAAPGLSQSAIRALRSTAGVSCVLVGARRTSYVADIVRELYRPAVVRERQQSWEKLAAVS